MISFSIPAVSDGLKDELQNKIDTKTKPLGALGMLEEIALKIGLIQNSLCPQLRRPQIVVFAGDHGIVAEGVSAYPQDVTYQMVLNFLNQGAAINVFCKQNNIGLTVVDAGVNYDFPKNVNLVHAKIAKGTKNFLQEPAMSLQQCQESMVKGAQIVKVNFAAGCNIIGFGDMGIGNTSSASAIMHFLAQCPIERCVGRGAGLNDEQFKRKINILKEAVSRYALTADDPLKILATFGGFEIAMMSGAMLQAASSKMIILVDGFIATSAFLVAYHLHPNILDYAFFCHRSDEKGHHEMLHYLKVKPILDLQMRLGEGTGATLAFPILQAAVAFLNDMASFTSASVSTKNKL